MGSTLILAPGPTLPYRSGFAAPAGCLAPGRGVPSMRTRTLAVNRSYSLHLAAAVTPPDSWARLRVC